MNTIQAIILAIVEGITEFLPISSTGHMILTSSIMGIETDDFTKLFEISIQLGAILAVIVLYWKKFVQVKDFNFYIKLVIGVLPALILGKLFSDKIDALLESPTTVAWSMLTGGIFLLFIDNLFKAQTIINEPDITNKKAFIIGCWQTLAMIPGVSRSAASIIGGMQQKLTRDLAAEFSFYLAVPTMAAATLYSLFLKKWEHGGVAHKGYELMISSSQNITAFIIGNVIAFIVALLAIRFLIEYLKRHGFKIFGYYRIAVGIILLVLIQRGFLFGH